MELNFAGLNKLAASGAIYTAQKSDTTPAETHIRRREYKTTIRAETPLERPTDGLETLQRQADRNKAERDLSVEVYREYQENTRKSEQLQSEILKGVRAGEDITSLFLKAVEAISRMTSNKLFLSQIEGDLKTIYGHGLHEASPLRLELTETRTRLEKLQEAQKTETEQASLQRIKQAIKAHEARIAELTGLLQNA